MARKVNPPKVNTPDRIYCRDCESATDFNGNSCYCKSKGHRVCAVNRYGKPYTECKDYYKQKN